MQLDQKYLPEKQLHDAAIQACNKVYGPGNEGFASVRNSITLSFPFIAQINTRLQVWLIPYESPELTHDFRKDFITKRVIKLRLNRP